MKAIVCKEFGPPSSLVYEDVELPELKKKSNTDRCALCWSQFSRHFNYSR